MQCAERVFILLDGDIIKNFPEWKDAVTFKGVNAEDDKPILVKVKNHISLRHLLFLYEQDIRPKEREDRRVLCNSR